MARLHEGRTLTGAAGTAVEVIVDEVDRPDHEATLATWFLTCPGQSPAWSNYLLSVIHLRPIPGAPPAHLRVAAATHEVMLIALDPGRNPVALDNESWSFLHPINLMEQVQLPNDDEAVKLLELAVQAVVDGALWAEPPLSGQVEPWRTSLVRTAAHARGEEHAP